MSLIMLTRARENQVCCFAYNLDAEAQAPAAAVQASSS
jgi:hypothetical protein